NEERKHDTAIGGAKGFPEAYFAGTVGYGHEHDVDDSNCAQRQRDQPNTTQKQVHGVEDLADLVYGFNRIPFVEGFGKHVIESMIAGNDLMDFGLCDFMYVAGARLIVHERNSVLR